MAEIIKEGDKVKVEYEGRFEDGTVFDKTDHGDHSHPLEFEVGKKQVIPGFEDAVKGMKKGEEKEVTVQPKNAYGERNEELKQKIPRSSLPQDQEPKEGMMLVVGTPQGQQMPVKIVGVSEKEITLDLNHPLAGKTLIFKIKVVSFEAKK